MSKQTPILTIVIPVYNCGDWLPSCLDSIIDQKFTCPIEVICANNNSTDHSVEVIERYMAKYPYIRIVNETTQGVSSARNAGIDAATGEYITFCDSDDHYKTGALRQALELIQQNGLDSIAYPDMGRTTEDFVYRSSPEETAVYVPPVQPVTAAQELTWLSNSACALMIKREILEQRHLRFATDVYYGEDGLLMHQLTRILSPSKHGVLKNAVYVYRHRQSSLTHTLYNDKPKEHYQQLLTLVKAYRNIWAEIVVENEADRIYRNYTKKRQDAIMQEAIVCVAISGEYSAGALLKQWKQDGIYPISPLWEEVRKQTGLKLRAFAICKAMLRYSWFVRLFFGFGKHLF